MCAHRDGINEPILNIACGSSAAFRLVLIRGARAHKWPGFQEQRTEKCIGNVNSEARI